MSCVFLTFGAGRFWEAVPRLASQAAATRLFDEVKAYTPERLFFEYPEFLEHLKYIIDNPCGYGHWLWKPFLIYKTLEKLAPGDVLFYLDAGCEILPENREAFREYLDQLKVRDHIIAFDCAGYAALQMKYWTTRDLIRLLRGSGDEPTIWAGGLGFRRDVPALSLIKEWLDTCLATFPEKSLFIGQVHDQAVLSLIARRHPATIISTYMNMDYGARALHRHPACWQIAGKQPFLVARNATGRSILPLCRHPLYRLASRILFSLKARSYGGGAYLAKHWIVPIPHPQSD